MKRQRAGRFWTGAICATLWTWLALALNFWVAALVAAQFSWGLWLGALYGLLAFVAIFYCAGIIGTFFWYCVANSKDCQDWGAWTVLIALTPILAVSPIALLLLIFLLPCAVLPFLRGAEWGEDCWKRERWRHFFGLSNDWERDNDKDEM